MPCVGGEEPALQVIEMRRNYRGQGAGKPWVL